MKLTTFMRGNCANLPHLLNPSSEPGSLVPYLFWTLYDGSRPNILIQYPKELIMVALSGQFPL